MRLVLSGGGTGGHIVPNIALIQELKERYPDQKQLELLYIGGRTGMEKSMIEDLNVNFKGIFTGKIRRYFSWLNFVDLIKIPIGFVQSFLYLLWFRPTVVFCKGGYVCFPVAMAAWVLRVPTVLHESDVVPGLANRISAKFAKKICVSFDESKKFFPKKDVVLTGNPIRRDITKGDEDYARRFTGLNAQLPVLVVMGGSQGAHFINSCIWDNLESILNVFEVVHICGKGSKKSDDEIKEMVGEKSARYSSFEFIMDELKDVYALADIFVSRAGAMTLAEFSALSKPAILIPLSKKASRGDQIDNAKAYAKNHLCAVIEEEDYNDNLFLGKLNSLLEARGKKDKNKSDGAEFHDATSSTGLIISLLEKI